MLCSPYSRLSWGRCGLKHMPKKIVVKKFGDVDLVVTKSAEMFLVLSRWLRFRIWLGLRLIHLAAFVMGMGFEVKEK